MELKICSENVVEWLTDERWIVFSFYSGFGRHLEHCYFAPGTPKNAEFQVMVTPVILNGLCGVTPFYRIKDTAENREILRAALAEFYGKHLLTSGELDQNIRELRRRMQEKVRPTLR